MSYSHNVSSARKHIAITPHDTNEITNLRSLYITIAGSLIIIDSEDREITYAAVPVGEFKFIPKIIKAASTATVVGWF